MDAYELAEALAALDDDFSFLNQFSDSFGGKKKPPSPPSPSKAQGRKGLPMRVINADLDVEFVQVRRALLHSTHTHTQALSLLSLSLPFAFSSEDVSLPGVSQEKR